MIDSQLDATSNLVIISLVFLHFLFVYLFNFLYVNAVSQEQTSAVFEGLCRLVKGNPADCTSAERVVFAYLYDLYANCSFLKVRKYNLLLV